MKSYLNFRLKGSQLLPVWIAFFLFFLVPLYLLIQELIDLTASEVPASGPPRLFFLYFIIVVSMAFTFIFYSAKLVIESLEYKGLKIICDYHLGKYIGTIISGLVLSIVTIGIYLPWFFRNLQRFFVHGASYDSHKFSFKGKGRKLFLILTLTIFIPFLVVGFIMTTILTSEKDILIYQVIVISSLVSVIYLTFKWMINIRYKNYLIRLDTGFFHAMGKIAIELVLAFVLVFIFRWLTTVCITIWLDSDFFPVTGKIVIELLLAVITIGFYIPMAFIRLYRYFAEHTKSNIVDGRQLLMGYDGDQLADFLFIWRQILLTVITLGIYYPWAFSRIGQRVLTQTYLSTDLITAQSE
jgi:uncharacterized membrane protein YjgN (DUF898 family)